MEVHHHPHVEKKRFKEYFFEFIMLFLAVTLGFIAENIRESIGDHAKEKEYVKSLFEDVQQDIQQIQEAIDFQQIQVKGKDSLIQLINNGLHSSEAQKMFYDLHWRYVGYNFPVAYSKRTITQLLNSGALRLIRNKKVSDAIAAYASNINKLESVDQPNNVKQSYEALMESKKLIDTKYMRSMPGDTLIPQPYDNPIVRNSTGDAPKDFSFVLEMNKENIIIWIGTLKRQLADAEALLQLLKTEYHLKKE